MLSDSDPGQNFTFRLEDEFIVKHLSKSNEVKRGFLALVRVE
jgi:hypothetical protein